MSKLNLPRRRQVDEDTLVTALRFLALSTEWTTWVPHAGVIVLQKILVTVDVLNIWTGWLKFAKGEAPDLVWDINGTAQPRPSQDHRRGFSVYLWFDDLGLRDLCSNTAGLIHAINILFDECEPNRLAGEGWLPVVEAAPSTKVDSPNGTYFEPSFRIVDWAPRPSGLLVRKPPTPPKPPAAAAPGTALLPGLDRTLDDSIPFITCDPAAEPYLARRNVA